MDSSAKLSAYNEAEEIIEKKNGIKDPITIKFRRFQTAWRWTDHKKQAKKKTKYDSGCPLTSHATVYKHCVRFLRSLDHAEFGILKKKKASSLDKHQWRSQHLYKKFKFSIF